ncbi:H-NS family nucleoid-associated regulatory protein [Bradyrhizobium lablabi]|uniref:H-NS histone family protein n=1 Tax=Bradyrhizobium lablabi TaxID=722472 RepID=UPI001BABEDF2|nr:H-NS histone family protein [Bradyrhizobium lablabi]MBR0697808.1 H-NS histone family protein [Bradyrhizobium lablabi]
MKTRQLETMSLDELWALHDQLTEVLAAKVESKKLAIERQLEELGRKFGGSPTDIPQPRPYPPVQPKFRNPMEATETWSGRGRHPQWVVELLARGGSLEDCRIQ